MYEIMDQVQVIVFEIEFIECDKDDVIGVVQNLFVFGEEVLVLVEEVIVMMQE